MRIRIDYTTAYEYSLPAGSVVQLLRVKPRGGWDQHVNRWRVDVDADGSLRTGIDVFGNATHLFTAEALITALTMTVTGEVDTSDAHGMVRGFPEPLPPTVFLRQTALCAGSPGIVAFANGLGDGPVLDRLHLLLEAINTRMAFDADATGTGTDAATAFAQARGVCQDYTHIFIAAARLMGIPARYVSGHFVRNDGTATQPAGHAWAEALVPDLGWVGFDPTNGISVTTA
ncbi:MAG: transglutaminase family protein, partial [Janthinobacterium lividum]